MTSTAAALGMFETGSDEEMRIAEQLAYDHLYDHGDRLLEGVADLLTRQVQIRDGRAHVRVDQVLDDIPVFGGQTIVHLTPEGEVDEVTDGFVRGRNVDVKPNLYQYDAAEIAVDRNGGWDTLTEDPTADLVILPKDGEQHLTWMVRMSQLDGTSGTSMPVVFVDAHSGDVVWAYDNLQTTSSHATTPYAGAVTFDTDSVSGGYSLASSVDKAGTYSIANQAPGYISASSLTPITSSSTTWTSNLDAVDAHVGMLQTLSYFKNSHGRNAMNGVGGPTFRDAKITSIVHYGSRYSNAFWNGTAMVYGDGDGYDFGALTSLDIAAHELTHGVTGNTANLTYANESGALNESMSDVFAALVENAVQGDGTHNWQIGEKAFTPGQSGDALRYMNNPTADYQSTDHYLDRYTGASDNGGVHLNSGIANLAFYLTVKGGKHPRPARQGITVSGIGYDAAGKIWFKALTEYMTPSTDFFGARNATMAAARALYGNGSGEEVSVAAAWAAVGVGTAISGTVPTPTPTPTPTPSTGGGEWANLSAAAGAVVTQAIVVPAGATNLEIRISGGTGDADLYTKFGSMPTDSAYDCRPYKNGNDEVCTVAVPAAGTYYVRVKAYSAFAGLKLTASFVTPVVEESGGLDELLSEAKDSETRFTFEVPAGTPSLVVKTSGGTGDADLYLRRGSEPTKWEYDCRPYQNGNEEVCTVTAPAAGTYHVMVHAYSAFTGLHLTAEY
jgi:Zn-dependent metalloprotease